jgi:hypothetical protein
MEQHWPDKVFAVRIDPVTGLMGDGPSVKLVQEEDLQQGDVAVEYTLNSGPFSVRVEIIRNYLDENQR